MKKNVMRFFEGRIFFTIGLLLLGTLFIFHLFQGENITVTYHDQLDSEVLYYMLRSNDISSFFKTSFDNFMNENAEVTVVAIFQLLLYAVFPPVYAYIVNMFLVRVVAYVGMYLLLRKLKVETGICFLTALLFSILPIYSVYGLTIMGIPLLTICFGNLLKKERMGVSYFYIAFYGLYSSLVLLGFGILGILFITLFFVWLKERKAFLPFGSGVLELFILYLLSNISLINSVFLKEGNFVSHKSDCVLTGSPFWKNFMSMLIKGHYHAGSCHIGIWCVLFVGSVLLVLNHKKIDNEIRQKIKRIGILLAGIVLLAFFYALFLCDVGVNIRNKVFEGSALKAFQFNRIHFLYPVLWYVLLGLLLSCIYMCLKKYVYIKKILYGLIFLIWLIPASIVLVKSDVIHNVTRIWDSEESDITWKAFFAENLFKEIDCYISQDKENYRVVSIGLYPSIALYNGFFCLDGYSNNYSLSYKNEFLKVIEDELARDASEYAYFMNWGNRCYIFSSELGMDWLVSKTSQKGIQLDLNVTQLKKLGCKYIFSAVPLLNFEEIGIAYEGYFESESSYYGIYLYQINN